MLVLPTPFVFGKFIKRYKRFFVDVLLDDGIEVIAHCPNPGAMLGVLEADNRVAVTFNNNPARKLSYTWQLVESNGTWIGINTHLPNEIVAMALKQQLIPEIAGYSMIQREVKYGTNSRIDFLLTHVDLPPCYLEIKNVHLKRNGIAQFPDCVTARGAKHMAELALMRQQGMRCVVLYVVQRNDVQEFSLAADIDPGYAKAAEMAKASGVEMLAYKCEIDLKGVIGLGEKLVL